MLFLRDRGQSNQVHMLNAVNNVLAVFFLSRKGLTGSLASVSGCQVFKHDIIYASFVSPRQTKEKCFEELFFYACTLLHMQNINFASSFKMIRMQLSLHVKQASKTMEGICVPKVQVSFLHPSKQRCSHSVDGTQPRCKAEPTIRAL